MDADQLKKKRLPNEIGQPHSLSVSDGLPGSSRRAMAL
jgi:hypothetical protein